MRTAEINRKTAETDISLKLCLDGSGKSSIQSGVGFLDHMLTLFAKHGRFDLDLVCKGDTYVDDHHSVEDIGICLGEAFCSALGDKAGIRRYADTILPMDEALVMVAADISGRGMAPTPSASSSLIILRTSSRSRPALLMSFIVCTSIQFLGREQGRPLCRFWSHRRPVSTVSRSLLKML